MRWLAWLTLLPLGCFSPSDIDPIGSEAVGDVTATSGDDPSTTGSGSSTQTGADTTSASTAATTAGTDDPDGAGTEPMSSGESGASTTGEPRDTCGNGTHDGDETDVDCGGSCLPCDAGMMCLVDDDCSESDCLMDQCLVPCNPLLLDCAPTEGCYPVDVGFYCVADASGETGTFADPCEFINACDNGFACIAAKAVPDCMGGVGCCTPYCDTSAPDCPAPAQCTAFYRPGAAPPGFETVGLCTLPM